jgi:hypothetical protein
LVPRYAMGCAAMAGMPRAARTAGRPRGRRRRCADRRT